MNIFRLIPGFFLMILVLSSFALGQTRKPAVATVPATTTKADSYTPQEIAESGSFDGKVYTNKLLAFTVSIPEKWAFASADANQTTLEMGREIIKAGESASQRKGFDRSIARTRILFQASVVPAGQPGNSAVFQAGIEKMETPQTQKDYSDFNKNLVINALKGNLKKDSYSKIIGGQDFTAFEIEVLKDDFKVQQTYMVRQIGNVMFFAIITLTEDTHKKTLDDALNTLRFNKFKVK